MFPNKLADFQPSDLEYFLNPVDVCANTLLNINTSLIGIRKWISKKITNVGRRVGGEVSQKLLKKNTS